MSLNPDLIDTYRLADAQKAEAERKLREALYPIWIDIRKPGTRIDSLTAEPGGALVITASRAGKVEYHVLTPEMLAAEDTAKAYNDRQYKAVADAEARRVRNDAQNHASYLRDLMTRMDPVEARGLIDALSSSLPG